MVHSWKCSNICLKILSSIAWINHYHLIIYPLIAKVVRWFQNQFPPFFPILNCPLGPGELQACLIHNVFCPPLPLSALSSSPFYCTCMMVLARSGKKKKKLSGHLGSILAQNRIYHIINKSLIHCHNIGPFRFEGILRSHTRSWMIVWRFPEIWFKGECILCNRLKGYFTRLYL